MYCDAFFLSFLSQKLFLFSSPQGYLVSINGLSGFFYLARWISKAACHFSPLALWRPVYHGHVALAPGSTYHSWHLSHCTRVVYFVRPFLPQSHVCTHRRHWSLYAVVGWRVRVEERIWLFPVSLNFANASKFCEITFSRYLHYIRENVAEFYLSF